MTSIKEKFKYIMKNTTLKLHFHYASSPVRDTKYYFSTVLIFKDEARYLKEWIEYHRIVGVDHIYAYNDGSIDEYKDVLKPYITDDFVTLIEWRKPHSQFEAYEDCFRKFRNETFWMMFIDIDEFICPRIARNVKEWIKPFEKYPSVEMYWMHFTTGGILEYDKDSLVIERFTVAKKNVYNYGKMVLNTAYEPVRIYHHHIDCYDKFFFRRWQIPTVKEDGNFIFEYENTKFHKIPKKNTIQLNHYWSKSFEEYTRKMKKGDVAYVVDGDGRESLARFLHHEYQGVKEEKTIFRFLFLLKYRMFNIQIPDGVWKEIK